MRCVLLGALFLVAAAPAARANPPVASYIFPAGGQRGTTVSVRVGGLFLHNECGLDLIGPGVKAPTSLKRTSTIWFEGPLLPLPDSQRQEDYPKDMAGEFAIASDAPLGLRYGRLWTSQGATPAMKFVVGELPEIIEHETDGDPLPVQVQLPVTINGRIFPREDIDVWSFQARKGQRIRCEVDAARLGSPLDARLEVRDSAGRRLAESDDTHGADPCVRFVAPTDGEYHVRIQDTQNQGGQAYVYRLTLTTGPAVEHVYPLGGKRGSTLKVDLVGQELPQPQAEIAIPNNAAADLRVVIPLAGKSVLLDVDDLPEYRSEERTAGQPIPLPAMLNGRIAQPGVFDAWPWTGRKGETIEFELRAGRLGSRLDGVLTIQDAGGKELARAEATGPGQLDPSLRFTVPADGTYTVKVQDRFRSRGGPGFAYRLRAAAPGSPDFRLTFATDAVTVPRKGQAKLKVTAERLGGLKGPIALQVDGMPEGVSVTGTTIAAGQSTVELTFKAEEAARIQTAHLKIEGLAKVAATELRRPARPAVQRGAPQLDDVLLAVALPTPFVLKGEYDMGFAARGSVHKRRYTIERNGYVGPIEVSLTDRQARHLQGVAGATITVPAGATEFTYSAYLPPWMETGRTCRVCVMGVGVVKDRDGSEHRVSFSSVNQNEQLVAVVGPGRIALDVERTSLFAQPRQTILLPVRVKRGEGIGGDVSVELIVPPHMHGVSAAPAVIAADQGSGELAVRFADAPLGPFNMPVLIRATLRHNGEPLTAEVRIDVQP
jgi:Bacterial pre-peptidase C-terminal domain